MSDGHKGVLIGSPPKGLDWRFIVKSSVQRLLPILPALG